MRYSTAAFAAAAFASFLLAKGVLREPMGVGCCGLVHWQALARPTAKSVNVGGTVVEVQCDLQYSGRIG